MAYVKLDTGVLDSTLWTDRDGREVFITALLMAVPHELTEPAPSLHVRSLEPMGFVVPAGWYGKVAAAGVGIARRAGIETEAGLDALERLAAPDSESRTPDFDGRRLVRVDGGYLILNFMAYRDRDTTAAERQQRYRDRHRGKPKRNAVERDGNTVTGRDVTQRHAVVSSKQEEVRSKQEEEVELPTHAPLANRFENADQMAAYARFRAAARVPASVDAALRGVAEPMTGNRTAYPWPVIGAALVELEAKSERFGTEAVRVFCRKIVARDRAPEGVGSGATRQDRNMAAIEEGLRRYGGTHGES